MSGKQFPNDSLLVSTDWVAAHLEAPDLRLVEVTAPGSGYVFGHIPGAVFLDLAQLLTGRVTGVPSTVGPPEEVAAVLGQLGLAPDKQVVVYDEIGGASAAQLVWLLEYLGFERVHMLEGGLERWLAEGRPQSSARPKIEPASFVPILQPERLATADWIASHLDSNELQLIDCRTDEEYRAGHIPGAKNRSWDKTLALRAYQAFRDAETLKAELDELGIDPDKPVVTYCGTGRRSAHTYLLLRLLGYPQARNYDGSWTEWEQREDLPKE